MSRNKGRIFIGIGGWSYDPWRESFFPSDLPRKRELEYASRKLTSIEINGTFYRTQTAATFAKWRDETPEGFVFSVKAPRFAMMRKKVAEAGESIARFFGSGVTELGDRLGPILWQFAPTRKFDAEFFEGFMGLLPKEAGGRALRHAIEVRHESFCAPQFVAAARAHGVAIVVAGDSKYPLIADVTAPFVYARIMGTRADVAQGYDGAELDRWAAGAKEWAAGDAPPDLACLAAEKQKSSPRDVYLYVISGAKERNPAAAMGLIERVAS
ncbi:DUF72 domain-containing protein [Methylocystis sp. 9N]|uniref:DUF72 domain-containing protein n=1 Tax=Methylocystis borbori TaxID=3118750 RepID=A0ABU7XCS4_9HYPH